MIAVDVRIRILPGGPTLKTAVEIESANGTNLVQTFLEDMSADQKALLAAIFEGTGRYVGRLMG